MYFVVVSLAVVSFGVVYFGVVSFEVVSFGLYPLGWSPMGCNLFMYPFRFKSNQIKSNIYFRALQHITKDKK